MAAYTVLGGQAMSEDKDKRKDEPAKYPVRKDTEADTLKRSRYCAHGNLWGRCPKGC